VPGNRIEALRGDRAGLAAQIDREVKPMAPAA
jgi:hypothetical protein